MAAPLSSPSTSPAPSSSQTESRTAPARRVHARWRLVAGLLTVFLLGTVLLNIWMGEASISPGMVLRVIAHHTPGLASHVPSVPAGTDAIVWQQRLPRALGGVLIGMLLAMAGVAFQSLLLNPLADPYFVGVSSGSALGSVVVILLGGAGWLAGFAQTLAAFGTGLLTMLLVYALARVRGRVSVNTFLLAGIVIATFLYAITKLAVALAERFGDPGRAAAILSQLLGSLQLVSWRDLGLLLPFGLAGGVMLWTGARELDLMAMGEESAAHQGLDTEAFKRRIIVAGSLVTAAAVSVAGIIAFVGMVVPQIARRLVGPKHGVLLPTAMLLGGLVLVVSDWLSRVYLNQLEVGVITSIFGAPVFCYLLRRRITAR